jgi:hypothetical protein
MFYFISDMTGECKEKSVQQKIVYPGHYELEASKQRKCSKKIFLWSLFLNHVIVIADEQFAIFILNKCVFKTYAF